MASSDVEDGRILDGGHRRLATLVYMMTKLAAIQENYREIAASAILKALLKLILKHLRIFIEQLAI